MTSAPNPRLAYRIATDPAPLATGVTGRVNVGVFQPGAVYCSEIQVALPIGSGATDFSAFGPTTALNTNNWNIAVSVASRSALGLVGDGDAASVLLTPGSAKDWLIPYPLVLQFQARVNDLTGDFPCGIVETSGPSANDQTQLDVVRLLVTKTSATFFMKNLIATDPTAPTVPLTEVANGQTFELQWESNGTWFELYVNGELVDPGPGKAMSWTIEGGIAEPTTYAVVGSVVSGPDAPNKTTGYQPIYLYETITVDVVDPDLTARSLVVPKQSAALVALTPGQVDVTGSVQASGDVHAANAVLGGALSVTDGATVSGQTTLGGATTVGSTAQPTSLTVNGTAQTTDTLTAPRASMGTVTATSGLVASSATVAMQGALQVLSPGTFTPPTDGVYVELPAAGPGTVLNIAPVQKGQPLVVPNDSNRLCAWWPIGSAAGADALQASAVPAVPDVASGVDHPSTKGESMSATENENVGDGDWPTVRFTNTPVLNKTNATVIVGYGTRPNPGEIQMIFPQGQPQGPGGQPGACLLSGSTTFWYFAGDPKRNPPAPAMAGIAWAQAGIYGNNVLATIDYPSPTATLPTWTFGPVSGIGAVGACWIPPGEEHTALMEEMERGTR